MHIHVAPQAKIFMSIRVSFMHIRVAPQAEKLFTTHSRFIHAHSCCAAGEKSTLVYSFLAPIYRWYMLVYRPYTDGISPIYRWYIAHIPILHHSQKKNNSRPIRVLFTVITRCAADKNIFTPPADKKNYKIIIFLNSTPSTRTHIINNVYFCTLNLFERHLYERNKLYTNQTLLFYIYLL